MLTEAVSIFNNFLESFGSGTAVLHHFGAMLTGIFSKQIGKNIEELIFENAESKQNDRAQKDLQEAILKRYGYFNTGADLSTVQAENPALKEELEYAEKIFKLRGFKLGGSFAEFFVFVSKTACFIFLCLTFRYFGDIIIVTKYFCRGLGGFFPLHGCSGRSVL